MNLYVRIIRQLQCVLKTVSLCGKWPATTVNVPIYCSLPASLQFQQMTPECKHFKVVWDAELVPRMVTIHCDIEKPAERPLVVHVTDIADTHFAIRRVRGPKWHAMRGTV